MDFSDFLLFSALFRRVHFSASGAAHAATHTGIDSDRTGRTGWDFTVRCCPFFEKYFLLHCLADDCADGIRRVLLHLCCGVGVGI